MVVAFKTCHVTTVRSMTYPRLQALDSLKFNPTALIAAHRLAGLFGQSVPDKTPIICAPARYGKRLAVLHAAESVGATVIELSLDQCTNLDDPERWLSLQLQSQLGLRDDSAEINAVILRANRESPSTRFLVLVGGLDLLDERLTNAAKTILGTFESSDVRVATATNPSGGWIRPVALAGVPRDVLRAALSKYSQFKVELIDIESLRMAQLSDVARSMDISWDHYQLGVISDETAGHPALVQLLAQYEKLRPGITPTVGAFPYADQTDGPLAQYFVDFALAERNDELAARIVRDALVRNDFDEGLISRMPLPARRFAQRWVMTPDRHAPEAVLRWIVRVPSTK